MRRLGYRLILTEIQHPAEVRAGAKFEMAMKWQNVGSAPCYQPYRLAYRLTNENGYRHVFAGAITVNHWLPGSIELFTAEFFKEPKDLPAGDINHVKDEIYLPKDMDPGSYQLSVGVVESASSKPVVRLGIKGRAEDGWYPLSRLIVTR